jgi:uncharacterized membrane protein YfcA
VRHWRAGTLDAGAALSFGPPAVVGALLGAELGLRVPGRVQLTVFALVLLLAAISMYLGPEAWSRPEALEKGSVPRRDHPGRSAALVILLGTGVGLLTGFVGVGGGFLYVPTLVLLAGLPMKRAIGTSLALIVVSCIAGVVRYHGTLALDWRAIGLFTAVALLGVAIGSQLVLHASQRLLRRSFAALLIAMGLLVLWQGR